MAGPPKMANFGSTRRSAETARALSSGPAKIATTLPPDAATRTVRFEQRMSDIGVHQYQLSIGPLDGELTDENNFDDFEVNVTRSEIKVVEHAPVAGCTAWSVDATPATVARVALTALLVDDFPDLVISGINRGENDGLGAWTSGTVAVAREGAYAGIPSLAVSLQLDWSDPQPDFEAAARWAKPVSRRSHSSLAIMTGTGSSSQGRCNPFGSPCTL